MTSAKREKLVEIVQRYSLAPGRGIAARDCAAELVDALLDTLREPDEGMYVRGAHAAVTAANEDPEAYATRAECRAADANGDMMLDHAIPLYRQRRFRDPAKAAFTAMIDHVRKS